MAHSFVAYIDESGDEGFVFKEHPERGSSEWFVLSALMIPAELDIGELRKLDATVRPLEAARQAPIHFAKLTHEQRIAVCSAIGGTNFRILNVCIHKPTLASQNLRGGYTLYFYATRYLLERISWLARDNRHRFAGDGRVKITFSNRTRMSYDDLRNYVRRLKAAPRSDDVRIDWAAIDPNLISTRQHKELLGLRAVDSVASGVRFGLELSYYGFCEDRYVRLMTPRVYKFKGKCRPYGMKFFPAVPAIQPERDNRYGWIAELFPK